MAQFLFLNSLRIENLDLEEIEDELAVVSDCFSPRDLSPLTSFWPVSTPFLLVVSFGFFFLVEPHLVSASDASSNEFTSKSGLGVLPGPY